MNLSNQVGLIIKGEVNSLPPDKSISHRTALIGAISTGTTEIHNYSGGGDNQTTLSVLKQLGVDLKQEIKTDSNGISIRSVVIHSKGLWDLRESKLDLDCQNSGSTIRMLSGILSAQPFRSRLIGDSSLKKRPMKRIAEPLSQMGASFTLSQNGTPPIEIIGTKNLKSFRFEMPVASAQVKSSVMLAALHAEGTSEIIEPVQTRNHTEVMLGFVKFDENPKSLLIDGKKIITAKPFSVPADASAACFIISLGLLAKESDLILRNVGLNPTRTAYLEVIKEAGAKLLIENRRIIGGEPIGDIILSNAKLTTPIRISDKKIVANAIDELPMLSVLSAIATNEFELRHAHELRTKESDRISALVLNLRKLGFVCEEYDDGFVVKGRDRIKNELISIQTFSDHRIAMSFTIAGAALGLDLILDDAGSTAVSFPNFFELILSLKQRLTL